MLISIWHGEVLNISWALFNRSKFALSWRILDTFIGFRYLKRAQLLLDWLVQFKQIFYIFYFWRRDKLLRTKLGYI